jgi:hypothetical protein
MNALRGRFKGIPKHELRLRLAVKRAKRQPSVGLERGSGKFVKEPIFDMVQRLRTC